MKKKLLLFCAIASTMFSVAQTAPCSELFYSMYICGSGDNKAMEIYNPTNASITLTGMYRVAQYYAGHTTNPDVKLLQGTIGAYSTFVIACGQVTTDSVLTATPHYATAPCDTALIRVSNQLDTAHYPGALYFSGTSALTLDKNVGTMASPIWIPVDIFACIGEYPTSPVDGKHYGWWNVSPYASATSGHSWTKYHTLIRKTTVQVGTSTNPTSGTWDVATQWDSLPDSHTGITPNFYPQPNQNSTNQNTHFCTCNPSSVQEYADVVHVNIFPNPTDGGIVNVIAGKSIEMIQVYNLVGQIVLEEKMTNPQLWVSFNTSGLAKGTYLVKSSFGNNEAHVSKVILQ